MKSTIIKTNLDGVPYVKLAEREQEFTKGNLVVIENEVYSYVSTDNYNECMNLKSEHKIQKIYPYLDETFLDKEQGRMFDLVLNLNTKESLNLKFKFQGKLNKNQKLAVTFEDKLYMVVVKDISNKTTIITEMLEYTKVEVQYPVYLKKNAKKELLNFYGDWKDAYAKVVSLRQLNIKAHL